MKNFGNTVGNVLRGIHDLTEGWNFWDWIIAAGLAIGGIIALRWLINLFKGKNPLQTVADGFSFLEKAVGWSLLIWAFTEFTKALTDFVECMKTANWGDITKTLITLGGAFGILVLAIFGLTKIAKWLGTDWLQMLGLAAIITAFSLLVLALKEFIEVAKDCTAEQLLTAWGSLAAGLATVGLAISALLLVLSAVVSSGVGAAAVLALGVILGVTALVIYALADFVRALGESEEGVRIFLEGIANIVKIVCDSIVERIKTVGEVIVNIIKGVFDGIKTILEPILDFIDSIIDKIVHLAEVIAHEIGETIRQIIKTTGDVIIGIIHELLNAIPQLLDAILRFCRELGPAIENSVDAIMRSVTKLINFIISAIEYMINTLIIGSLNAMLSKIPFVGDKFKISSVSIQRFVPQYEKGTNYVPNDGLAYLHQGEAVIPKKYNQPVNTGLTSEERTYMNQMVSTMRSLDNTMKQGIAVNGQFVQRGSDLVAVVNKTNSQTGANLLSNVAYAR